MLVAATPMITSAFGAAFSARILAVMIAGRIAHPRELDVGIRLVEAFLVGLQLVGLERRVDGELRLLRGGRTGGGERERRRRGDKPAEARGDCSSSGSLARVGNECDRMMQAGSARRRDATRAPRSRATIGRRRNRVRRARGHARRSHATRHRRAAASDCRLLTIYTPPAFNRNMLKPPADTCAARCRAPPGRRVAATDRHDRGAAVALAPARWCSASSSG